MRSDLQRGSLKAPGRALVLALIAGALPIKALADETVSAPASEASAFHGQATFVQQGNFAFTSPYQGPNSLPGAAAGRETLDLTAFAGLRPWRGAEFWVNPEIDQGFGLAGTLGLAGFPSAEAYKVGAVHPYLRLQRLFLRQTVNLGGETSKVDPDLNQLGTTITANRLVFTIGKLSVPDIFDANGLAHDPKHDFLNWTLVDTGTFDYAADAWGYTVGGAAEWYQGPWTLRGGLFDLSKVPNSQNLDGAFGQFQWIAEIERRYTISGQAGSAKVTGFLTRGRMGRFNDATALSEETGLPADITKVRHYSSRSGLSVTLQQQITETVGIFLRGGFADGAKEPYEFTDVDQGVAGGVAVKGKSWGRAADTLALAGIVNGISKQHRAFLDAGGFGILVGDGKLPHPGSEDILETYYDFSVDSRLHVALDFQYFHNPAYNTERGPVAILALRLHTQF
jgi:high affinity Mn2+ porin